jgi:hypothetical protein
MCVRVYEEEEGVPKGEESSLFVFASLTGCYWCTVPSDDRL